MKPVIGMMCQNELSWLRLLMPLLVSTGIDITVLDGGSTDGTLEYLDAFDSQVHWSQMSFTTPGKQQNNLIDIAQHIGHDVLLKIDPDELMWPDDITAAFRLMETTHLKTLAFPRYNFIGDRCHYAPCRPYYPDVQMRMYRLNEGARYPNDYHSGLNLGELGWKWPNDCTTPFERRDVLTLQHMHIYHYGETKPRAERILQYMNYQRKTDGLEPLATLPDGHPIGTPPFNIEFHGLQPISPERALKVLNESADRIPAHPENGRYDHTAPF